MTIRNLFHPRRPSGVTLLEVLIACGILVIGLASVAALLPAAGLVFAETAAVDRGGSLAANAAAEIKFQQLVSATDFDPDDGIQTVVLDPSAPSSPINLFPDNPFSTPPFLRKPNPPTPMGEASYGRARYAAMISPLFDNAPVRSGTPARVAIIVFNNPEPSSKRLTLERFSPGVYTLTNGTEFEREADRRRYLPGCSWASRIKDDAVQWLRVGSSWSTYQPGGKRPKDSFVSFVDADALEEDTIDVYAFSNVLRFEEQIIHLK